MSRCEDQSRATLFGAEDTGAGSPWSWCRDCGAVFCRSGITPPAWPEDQQQPFGPIWFGMLREQYVWWLRPQGRTDAVGWLCKHARSRTIAHANGAPAWAWCLDCGSLWQSVLLPAAPWRNSEMAKGDGENNQIVAGHWHHPQCHGLPLDSDGGATYLYGAPDG